MKRLFSILLILMTAFYVLPLSIEYMADTETTCNYADKSTDDGKDTKKDNSKEFIPAAHISAPNKNCTADISIRPFLAALPVHFTIETPPPDKA